MQPNTNANPRKRQATDSKCQLLLSSDRDEKIRVSNFPKTHQIHTFCLGHKSVVASIVVPVSLADETLVISAGCDGRVCIWNYMTGELKHSVCVPLATATAEDAEQARNKLLIK